MLLSIALKEQLCLPKLPLAEGLFSPTLIFIPSPQGEMDSGGWLGSGGEGGGSTAILYFLGGKYS